MSRTVFTTLSNKKKMKNTLFIVLIIFILFTLRLAYIQFVWGSELSEKALEQQSQSRTITAKRGTIYDSTGKYILAENSSVESISINPTNIPQEIKDKVAHALSDIFELDYEKISKKQIPTKWFCEYLLILLTFMLFYFYLFNIGPWTINLLFINYGIGP